MITNQGVMTVFRKITKILLFNTTLGQTVLKNTFWLGVSQVLSRLMRAVIVIYAARALGAAGYGIFSYALAVAGFLSLFSDIGVNWILVKESARQPQVRGKYIATTFFAKTALLSIALLLLLLVAPNFIRIEDVKLLLPWVALLFFSDGLREFGFALIRSLERMEKEAGINLFTNFATVAVSVVALYYYQTPYALAVAYASTSLSGTALTAVVLRRYLGNLIQDFQRSLLAPMLKAIWPFAAMNLFWSIFMYTDVLMIGWLKTSPEVGWYSAAQRPIQLLLVLPVTVAASVLPAISRFSNPTNLSKFRLLVEQSLALVMAMALPLAAGGVIMSQPLMIALYGQDYLSAAAPFQVLSISFLITFPILIINNAIFAQGLQSKFLINMLLGALVNVTLNWWLIPRWGILGAALATIVSQSLAYGTIYYGMQKRIGFTMLPVTYRLVIATLSMAVSLILSNYWGAGFYTTIAIGITVYGLAVLALRDPLITRLKSIWSGVQ